MKKRSVTIGLAVLFALWLAPRPARAYYDDVHYALTYYIARQSGFTPAQAYRIASADSMVDWDPHTEPVQKAGQGLALIPGAGAITEIAFSPFLGEAQTPRWKFHAMRNELEFTDVLGSRPNGLLADAAVLAQRERLWQMALNETKNPGVFLHFFQDERPHHGYGTQWGHWPMLPGCVDEYRQAGLPIGGATDWVSFRADDVSLLCETTNGYLTKFMDRVSPHQLYRPYYASEYAALIQQLGAANKAPTVIDTELKRQLFVQFYVKAAGIPNQAIGNLIDPTILSDVSSQLRLGITAADLEKLRHGPDEEKAITVVNAALRRAGMSDSVPSTHLTYSLDSEGRPSDDSQLDRWVLAGALETSLKGHDPHVVRLKMKIRGRDGKEELRDLPGVDPIELKPGEMHRWPDLPIGDIELVIEKKDGSTVSRPLTLDKRENVFAPIEFDETIKKADLRGNVTLDKSAVKAKETVSATITLADDVSSAKTSAVIELVDPRGAVRSSSTVEIALEKGAVQKRVYAIVARTPGAYTLRLRVSGEYVNDLERSAAFTVTAPPPSAAAETGSYGLVSRTVGHVPEPVKGNDGTWSGSMSEGSMMVKFEGAEGNDAHLSIGMTWSSPPSVLKPGDVIELTSNTTAQLSGANRPSIGASAIWEVEGSAELVEVERSFAGITSQGALIASKPGKYKLTIRQGSTIMLYQSRPGISFGSGGVWNPCVYVYKWNAKPIADTGGSSGGDAPTLTLVSGAGAAR